MRCSTYRVNEIFYSLQGEGRHTGRAALFVRFSGCNLRCPFCDTNFAAYREYSAQQLTEELRRIGGACRFVVLTGGEPTLQVDDRLTAALKAEGYTIAMETNGTREIPRGVDWVTCSPKASFVDTLEAQPKVRHVNELKVVFDGEQAVDCHGIVADEYYMQPCDTGVEQRNRAIMAAAVDYILKHPEWQLSLQMHKMLNIK